MTDTALALPGWRHICSGKVRNLYEPEESSPGTSATLLVVATDRISAFDHILAPGIPEKGKILTQLSLWWFDRLADEFQLRSEERRVGKECRFRWTAGEGEEEGEG